MISLMRIVKSMRTIRTLLQRSQVKSGKGWTVNFAGSGCSSQLNQKEASLYCMCFTVWHYNINDGETRTAWWRWEQRGEWWHENSSCWIGVGSGAFQYNSRCSKREKYQHMDNTATGFSTTTKSQEPMVDDFGWQLSHVLGGKSSILVPDQTCIDIKSSRANISIYLNLFQEESVTIRVFSEFIRFANFTS